MILVLHPYCRQSELDDVLEQIQRDGGSGSVIQSEHRWLISITDSEVAKKSRFWMDHPSVEHAIPTLAPSSKSDSMCGTRTGVAVGPSGATLGGQRVGVIAGPCSVEDEKMLFEIADVAQKAGAIGLRGGAFKPRTNPYSFQGLGPRALELLSAARERSGLAIVTEVMGADQVEIVARHADVLQIGTRNMHNYNLLSAVGQTGKPVLLKRGWSATLDEFLHAAEYIIEQGNPNVILCERGIRTFELHVRNTLALATVPAIKERSPLPIIVDPSQGTGVASLVAPMSKAALAAGADGLILEIHPHPERAMTDGPQTLTLQQFACLMQELGPLTEALGRSLWTL